MSLTSIPGFPLLKLLLGYVTNHSTGTRRNCTWLCVGLRQTVGHTTFSWWRCFSLFQDGFWLFPDGPLAFLSSEDVHRIPSLSWVSESPMPLTRNTRSLQETHMMAHVWRDTAAPQNVENHLILCLGFCFQISPLITTSKTKLVEGSIKPTAHLEFDSFPIPPLLSSSSRLGATPPSPARSPSRAHHRSAQR